MPGGKGERRTTVGGRASAKYEVRSTKYELEIRRNSVAQGVGRRACSTRMGWAVGMGGEMAWGEGVGAAE